MKREVAAIAGKIFAEYVRVNRAEEYATTTFVPSSPWLLTPGNYPCDAGVGKSGFCRVAKETPGCVLERSRPKLNRGPCCKVFI